MIVIDTNALLDIYKCSEYAVEKIIDLFKTQEVFLPYQIYFEFMKNYKERRGKGNNNIKEEGKDVVANFKDIDAQISKLAKKFKKYDTGWDQKVKSFITDYEKHKMNLIAEKEKTVVGQTKDFNDQNDPVVQYVLGLYNNQKPLDYSLKEKVKIAEEGQLRFKYKLAPGYSDNSKNETPFSPYGDLLIWKKTIETLFNNKDNLTFITNEKKVDWWSDSTFSSPAQILVEEYNLVCPNCSFEMFSLYDFIEKNSEDEKLIGEMKELTYLLNAVRQFRNQDILFDSYFLNEIQNRIDDNFIENILSCQSAGCGLISEVNDAYYDIDQIKIIDYNFDEDDYVLSLHAQILISGECEVTIDMCRDYSENGNLNFSFELPITVEYKILLSCATENCIDECFDRENFYFDDAEKIECDYIYKDDLENFDAENYCPDCGSPITFETDGGNGFCIKCASNH